MSKLCWTLATAWLWLWAGRLEADPASPPVPQFNIAQWRSDTITPQNAVLTAVITMTQTRDGYLWLGTPDGLLRFDGVRFTSFNEGNTPGLKGDSVVKLFEDSRTNLWIGTGAGEILVVHDGRTEQVRIGHGTREGRLTSICEDPEGSIWLYTADGYLGQYREGGKIESWQVTANYRSNSRAMIVDLAGNVWLGTDFVLHRLRPGPKPGPGDVPSISHLSTPVAGLNYLLASRRGGYWRLAGNRIQKWTDGQLATGMDWPYAWNPNKPVRAACEDPDGNLIVGTGGDGVFWFDSQGKFVRLTAETGLSSDSILSLCFDQQGDLWIGTDGAGLNRVRRKVFEVLDESRGSTVQSVCGDGDGGLWIGYFDQRIDHCKAGKLDRYGRAQGLVDLGVKSVFLDHDRKLWAGTLLGGLLWYENGGFTNAPGSAALTRDHEISALYQDHSNRLWAGTQVGLAGLEGSQWALLSNHVAGIAVKAILEDRSGGFWIGTQGLGLIANREGHVTRYGKGEGLPSEYISCIYEDRDGVLWAGTSAGLARFNGSKWTSYAGHFTGITGNVGYLVDDQLGYLWMGSSVGLLRARKHDLEDFAGGKIRSVPVRAYGQGDGLPTRVCSQGSQPGAWRSSDGKLWFPTISGLVSVDPGQVRPNTNPPSVLIESVWIDGKPERPDTLRSPKPTAVVIPAARESLEIHYTSINLPAPDLGQFQYRMTGHEKEWITSESQRRYARYPKLPHGHYTFEVRACNEDGLWNDAPASLAVTVLPPFWETWWFITAVSVCLLAAIVGSVHYVSTQKLQRQLAALQQQEALEKERARIARDLHDQLGANLTQVALLGEMAETDKDLPQEVESHAKQISVTARETTRALDEIVWTVNPSNDTLDGLINYVCKYAQEYLALADLRYRLEVPAQLPAIPIPPELRHNVFLATKEAINNVVKHSGASSAWLRLRLEPDRFTLEIEDNGRGLPEGADKKGRNGLRNMRKRLEELGGSFALGPGHEGGTLVSLTAPLGTPPHTQSNS